MAGRYAVKCPEVNEIAGEQVVCLATVVAFKTLSAAKEFCHERWGANPPRKVALERRLLQAHGTPCGLRRPGGGRELRALRVVNPEMVQTLADDRT